MIRKPNKLSVVNLNRHYQKTLNSYFKTSLIIWDININVRMNILLVFSTLYQLWYVVCLVPYMHSRFIKKWNIEIIYIKKKKSLKIPRKKHGCKMHFWQCLSFTPHVINVFFWNLCTIAEPLSTLLFTHANQYIHTKYKDIHHSPETH
jgi:hypothetical protein